MAKPIDVARYTSLDPGFVPIRMPLKACKTLAENLSTARYCKSVKQLRVTGDPKICYRSRQSSEAENGRQDAT